MKKNFAVIEDNGGGLTLIVYAENAKIDYLHTGYEYFPGQLMEDIQELENGADPAQEWDGNDLYTVPNIEESENLESWFPQDQKGTGWKIVADNDGIYPEDMGQAAHFEFERMERKHEI